MNVFILTQEDAFYIPQLLGKFFARQPEGCRIVGAAILRGEIARENVADYLRFLGPIGFVQQGFHFARYKALDVVDRFLPLAGCYSVAGVLRKWSIPCHRPERISSVAFRKLLRELEVDLLISVACPQVVKKKLLALPPQGVINIHGALLPRYRGKLPSFWVLANGESTTGVTVHYMNEALDDGPIIVQKEVPISATDTLHSLILKSKVDYGAAALAEAVALIMAGKVVTKPNDSSLATYFSFPTPEAIAEFRRRGRKIR